MNVLLIYAFLNVCYVCQDIGRQPGPHLSPDTRGGSLPMRVRLHCRPHCSRRTLYLGEPSEELFSPPTGPRLCCSLDVIVAGAASATGGRGGLSNGRRQGGAPHPVLSRIYPVLSPPFSILLHVDQRPGSTGVAASGSHNKGGGWSVVLEHIGVPVAPLAPQLCSIHMENIVIPTYEKFLVKSVRKQTGRGAGRERRQEGLRERVQDAESRNGSWHERWCFMSENFILYGEVAAGGKGEGSDCGAACARVETTLWGKRVPQDGYDVAVPGQSSGD